MKLVAFSVGLYLLILGPAARCAEPVAHGAYLVELLGCGRCHTEGYLTPNRSPGPYLSGSRIGIAYTDDEFPAIVFPANLTADPETGIGGWTRDDIVSALTRGVGRDRHERLTVMPWIDYSRVSDTDLRAIAEYLLSLPPVRNPIPESIPEGTPSAEEYVRFGIYRFSPRSVD